jgi:hypothetical protein
MAKIKHIYTCPRCEESLTADEKPKQCPACQYHFPLVDDGGFTIPNTITEQSERILDSYAHRRFVLQLPIAVANNIMNDALNVIETIPGKKVRVSDIRNLMGMAIRIGEIAKKYEEFLLAGGTHAPELFLSSSGDPNHESATTRPREKATAPKPSPLFLPVGEDE